MKVVKNTRIQATPAQVWEVIGTGFPDADRWASAVYHSEARTGGASITGASFTGRTCETSIGPAQETILRYDEEAGVIAYGAQAEKMPGFVRGLTAAWRILSAGNGQVEVEMKLTVDLAPPFNLIMPPMMRLQMGPLVTKTLQELKHYIEHGTPHPRKLKQMAKTGKKAA